MPEGDVITLGYGGMFHDIGKVGVPVAILDKPNSLTDAERLVIEKPRE